MKVALWVPRASEIPGGHVVQLRRTAAALRNLGVDAIETIDPELPDVPLDLVHGFGMGVHARHVEMGRRRGLPVVITPIYVGVGYDSRGPERRVSAREGLGRLSRGVKIGAASLRGRAAMARRAFTEVDRELDRIRAWSAADILLVNAAGEGDELIGDLGVQTEVRFVPKAVDPALLGRLRALSAARVLFSSWAASSHTRTSSG